MTVKPRSLCRQAILSFSIAPMINVEFIHFSSIISFGGLLSSNVVRLKFRGFTISCWFFLGFFYVLDTCCEYPSYWYGTTSNQPSLQRCTVMYQHFFFHSGRPCPPNSQNENDLFSAFMICFREATTSVCHSSIPLSQPALTDRRRRRRRLPSTLPR